MSLTKEKIEKNYKKWVSTGESYGFLNDKLIQFLGVDLLEAPASSMSSMNNSFSGGLIDHMLRVAKYALLINDTLPETHRVTKTSLLKVCCLHQIGKAFLYKPCESDWHKTNQGKNYDFNEDLTSMKVSERSIYYATKNGIEFSEDEYQAILNFDKEDNDKQAKWHTNTLGVLLKMGITLAILEEKK